MNKYIDRDKLAEFARHSTIGIDANDIMRFPTADVVEVKHGEWIQREHLVPLPWDSSPLDYENYDEETHSEWEQYWHCSECDYEASRDWKPNWNYCPSCGADMRERKETE